MAWKIFGHETNAEALPAELRTILAQMQRERVAFETLTNAARESTQNISQITQPIADAQKLVNELQSRVKSLERLVPVLATLDEQTEAVSRVQRRTEAQVNQAGEEAKRLRAELDVMRATLEEALALKNDLAGFLELGGGFKSLRLDADKLAGQLGDVNEGFDRMRERQEEIRRASDAAATQLRGFEERQQKMQAGVAGTESRVGGLEGSLDKLSHAATEAADTRRQLTGLKALADQVTQKIAALEQQRDAVERATGQAQRLHDLMGEIDAKIRRAEQSAKDLGALEARVHEVRALHGEVLARTEEISARHDETKRADEDLRAKLAGMREEVERTVKRFELENQGLDAVSRRIVDLRGGLTDMEARFKVLEESSRSIADIRTQTEGLGTRLESVAESVGDLETQAERVRAVEANAGRVGATVEEMAQRVARLEKAQPNVTAALQDVAALRGTHEAVKDALEHVQAAEGEMARVREGQAATKQWLAGATDSMKGLRSELAAVEELRPTVERVRTEADRVTQATAQIEGRSKVVADLDERLTTLQSRGAQLDERTHALAARMEDADGRFQALASHAEEAGRVAQLVPSIVATAERVERRVADVDATVASVEARSKSLEVLAERTRALGQEIEQRQSALDKAAEHLSQASQLREQSAGTVQHLEERVGELTGALASAGGRLGEITGTLDDLDARAGQLRFAQKRMAQFEERLAKWEAAEVRLNRALEQVGQRQATLDALQADIHRLFEVAEKTVDDVRAVAGAREEVTQTRAMLESVLQLVSHAHDATDGLDHRKRQVEQAEQRLGRVEGLLSDLQGTLETLHGQKALLDQVVDKAGVLEFNMRQAEALVGRLREEREITDRVRAAVAELREEGKVARSA